MKRTILFFAALFIFTSVQAQLNMTLRDQVQYDVELSDVWGWADEATGKEYALVGLNNAVSVVDVTDPDNAVEVGLAPGLSSTWRDIKTWGDYAYITNETGDGIMVIDLGDLPSGGDISFFNWTPNIPGLGTLNSCHNIYIDEFGYAYLAGCNLNSGGMLIVDVFSTPGSPEYVAPAPSVYSHDVYVRDNKMYSSEIYAGVFTIYDVSDKNNITELGSQPTPFNFTHNTWLSDDGNTLFTTDELANAPIGAYDVSDPTDIQELDQYAPFETLGDGVIPHNVHVWQDYLIISYYTDGGIVVDASEPDNLIEVGNFDSFFGGGAGFNGAWGAYPFLPSETVLISDIGNGLYVLTPNYVRACRVEGFVTDINTNNPIAGATIVINADQGNSETTDFTGEYKTGIATAGSYTVTYSAPGYDPETLTLNLENGVTILQDVQLGALASYSLTGLTIKGSDGQPLGNTMVSVFNETFDFETVSDASGNFNLPQVFSGNYTIIAGQWGYEYGTTTVNISENSTVEITLASGYQDDFALDYGWQVSGNAASGQWELGEPVETSFQNSISNTGDDLPDDLGNKCYVTGNGGGGAGEDDVDNGNVILTSPVMDLTTYVEPIISYSTWFFNDGGQGNPNDELEVRISNGTTTAILETITASNGAWRPVSEFNLTGLIDITDNMQLIFETSDAQNSGHLVEAAVDGFKITEGNPSSVNPLVDYKVEMNTYPNPFSATTQLDYLLDTDFNTARIVINNQLGQNVETIQLNTNEGSVLLGENLTNGLYFILLEVDGDIIVTEKLLKVK